MDARDFYPEDGEQLSAYLDDALSNTERQRVEALLARSETARQALADLKRVRGLFDAWEPARVNPFFMRRFERRLAEEALETPSDRRWHQGLRWLAAAAVLIIAAGSAVLFNLRAGANVERVTLEGVLSESLDRQVREVATLTPSDLSKDQILDLVLSSNAR